MSAWTRALLPSPVSRWRSRSHHIKVRPAGMAGCRCSSGARGGTTCGLRWGGPEEKNLKRCRFAIPPTLVPRANGGDDDGEGEEKEGLAA
jgi:hypothetical protein